MGKYLNQRIKIVLVLFLALISIIMIKVFNNSDLAKVKEQRIDDSIIKIKYGSKLYESKKSNSKNTNNISNLILIDSNQGGDNKTKDIIKHKDKTEDNFFSKVKENICTLFNINKKVIIDTKDIDAPDNVEKIDVKVLEDNAIINFSEPKDNGTDYEYVVENEGQEEKLNFHSKTGIYGYSYKISNDENDLADEYANKLDNTPIIIQDIDWNKDYYLHIRTIDKSNNISQNNTIKIKLPSFGAKLEYVDKETGKILSMNEKINGMINDNYDAEKKIKEIQNYTLINTVGDVNGKLKRELTTIIFEYAQNKILRVKYIDEETGTEIAQIDEILGYIGKELKLNPKVIDKYIPIDYKKNIKIERNTDEVIFKYKKLEDKITTIISNSAQEDGRKIRIRYIDINTNKLLFKDEIVVNDDEKQIKYKLKKIEGYNLVNNIEDDSNNRHDKNLKKTKDGTKKENNIMDEIINSLDIESNIKNDNDNGLTEDEKRRTIAQYEIVMNCDESDYIIYYKK